MLSQEETQKLVDSNNYNGDSIQVLEDRIHVLRRPGMYIGETDNPHHLFSEIFDNALDEVMNGFSDRVEAYIDTNLNMYSIRDYGRGLPQDKKIMPDGKEKLTIDVIFTKLNAGGKFNNESYKISSGLHGVGSTVTNALSSYLKVSSFRNGHLLSLTYENNGELMNIEELDTSEPNGTLVEFIPDNKVFDSGNIPIEFMKQRCMISTAFGLKTSLYIDGQLQNDIEKVSIYDMIKEDEEVSIYDMFDDEVEVDGEKVKFAIQYTNDTSCKTKGFTNLLPNPQGGTHIKMIEKAFEDAWSRFNVKDIWTKDLYLGLRLVCAVFISETDFNGQTKEKLTTKRKYLEKFEKPISDKIYKWLKDNNDLREALIKRFQDHRASMNKLLSKKEIKDLIVVNNESSTSIRRKSIDSKVRECTSKNREDTELVIVEGDSAAGPLIQTRNIINQAILPLRGKLINSSKYDLVRLLNNQEIRSLVNTAGTGILDECDASKSRYERYLILTDADEDGKDIENLVLSAFVNLLPDLVKKGYVYIVVPPLYGWYEKGQFKSSNNRDDIPNGVHFERFKGLGQMNPNEIYDIALNKDTRNIVQIEYPEDVNYFNEVMTSSSIKYEILQSLGLIKYK